MDDSQFDALARRFGQRSSRRQALRSIAVGVAALITGGGSAAAARSITICHASGDSQTPFTPLSIPQTQFNSHARHGDFLRVDCCVDADCTSAGVCGSAVCDNGYCAQRPVAAGTRCGGSYCDGYDYCNGAFSCIPGTPVVCPASDNPCTGFVCDDDAEACIEQPLTGTLCTTDTTPDGICTDQSECVPTCDGCAAINGYDGVCPGAPEAHRAMNLSIEDCDRDLESCIVTLHATGFAGCTEFDGDYKFETSTELHPISLTTDASGAGAVTVENRIPFNTTLRFRIDDFYTDYLAV